MKKETKKSNIFFFLNFGNDTKEQFFIFEEKSKKVQGKINTKNKENKENLTIFLLNNV
jgi:hypothetical protein